MLGISKECKIKNLIKSLFPEIVGISFSVMLIAFALITFSLSIEIIQAPEFSLTAKKIASGEFSLLPASVAVAILIFLTKEVLDVFKKKSEKKRKLFAYKSLLAEELELNLWAKKRLLSIVTTIEEQEAEHPNAKYKLIKKRPDKNTSMVMTQEILSKAAQYQ